MMAKDKNNPAPPAAPACLRDVEAWIFDLDNTLYSATIDLFSQIDERMRSYIAAFLGLPIDNAYALQKQYFREYGTSLRGLMHVHGMEPKPFLDHVHNIDVSVLPAIIPFPDEASSPSSSSRVLSASSASTWRCATV